ncbi:hypothetical protein K469DRAFT_468623, partial [Zopfia rhizophila CBS 207.26]
MSHVNQIGQTPIRRSTRLASIARSESHAPSVTASVATTTATPSRAAAKRKALLPKLKASQSHAYGATGRLSNAADLAIPVTGFAQAFESQRENAVARDEEASPRNSANSSAQSSPSTSVHRANISEHGSTPAPTRNTPIHQTIQDRPTSALSSLRSEELETRDGTRSPTHESPSPSANNTSKSFGIAHEAGMTRVNGIAYHPRQRVPVLSQAAVQASGIEQPPPQPSILQSFFGIIGRNWMKVFGVLTILAITLMLLTPATQTSALTPGDSGVSMLGAIHDRVSYTWASVMDWISPNAVYEITSSVSSGDSRRVRKLENEQQSIKESIDRLEKHLPHGIVAQKNKDGQLEIPNEFWRALISKIQSEGLNDPSTTYDAQWIEWVEKNEAKIVQLIDRGFENRLDVARQSLEILDKKEFLELMQQDYSKLSDRIDKKIAEVTRSLQKELKAAAKEVAKKAFMDQIRLESLAYTNIIVNTELSLRKVNYFSPGLGARVDPYLTSSTFVEQRSAAARVYRKLFSLPQRRPPIAALEKWDEASECWCAAPNTQKTGQAQLTVNLGQSMYPKQVTVEHIPKEGTLDYRSAPQDLELWAEVSQDILEQVQPALDCSDGPKGWLCLGKFTYNIHGANHVQTFNLDVNLDGIEGVSRTMVRVTKNWGQDYTCLYRLRLHGE